MYSASFVSDYGSGVAQRQGAVDTFLFASLINLWVKRMERLVKHPPRRLALLVDTAAGNCWGC